jgi:Domain of unknown function (DUF4214)
MRTWLHNLRRAFQGQRRRPPVRSRRLCLEGLEDRYLLTLSSGPMPMLHFTESAAFNGPVATFHDTTPAAATDYTATINWGDQTTSPGTVTDNGNGDFTVSGSHTYNTSGDFSLQTQIHDNADNTDLTVGGTVTVADAPIQATGIPVTTTEGVTFTAPVASFTQADPNATPSKFGATIDWGDGQTSAGAIAANGSGGFTVSGTHAYATAGQFAVHVQINSNAGATGSADTTANVGDAALTATGLPVQAVENRSFTAPVATVHDANPLGSTGDLTATINWGDGQTSAGALQPLSGGGAQVFGTHTYAHEGTYDVSVSVTDRGGSTTQAASQATVADGALVAVGVPVNVANGTTANNVLVATFTDQGGPEAPASYTATITWGDGTAATNGRVTLDGTTFSVFGDHTYATPGRYPLSITVRSAGGSTATVPSTAVLGTDNNRFVAQAYRDILGREADPGGLAHFTQLLDQGVANRTQVAAQLLASREYRVKALTDLYHQILRRDPDAGGLESFVTFLGSGGTLAQVRALLLGSVEYFVTQTDGTVHGFLVSLYRDALGRALDPSGEATWTFLLNHGASRTAVALLVVGSREASVRLVTGFYQTFLRRDPDPGGLNTFANALQQGARDEDVIAALVGSNEYFAKL